MGNPPQWKTHYSVQITVLSTVRNVELCGGTGYMTRDRKKVTCGRCRKMMEAQDPNKGEGKDKRR